MGYNNLNDSRTAFAQVWRVGDKNKVYQHQQHIIKDKKMIKPLSTKLEKEVVYRNKFSLNRKYNSGGGLIEENFSRNTGKRLVATGKEYNTIISLRRLLREYNRIKSIKDHKISKIKRNIVDDLRAFGYHV